MWVNGSWRLELPPEIMSSPTLPVIRHRHKRTRIHGTPVSGGAVPASLPALASQVRTLNPRERWIKLIKWLIAHNVRDGKGILDWMLEIPKLQHVLAVDYQCALRMRLVLMTFRDRARRSGPIMFLNDIRTWFLALEETLPHVPLASPVSTGVEVVQEPPADGELGELVGTSVLIHERPPMRILRPLRDRFARDVLPPTITQHAMFQDEALGTSVRGVLRTPHLFQGLKVWDELNCNLDRTLIVLRVYDLSDWPRDRNGQDLDVSRLDQARAHLIKHPNEGQGSH